MTETTNPPLSPAIQSLSLLRLTRNEAQARSMLAQRALGCTVKIGDGSWQLAIEPLSAKPPGSNTDWRIDAQWAGARLSFFVPAETGASWIRARFPKLELPALPVAFATAALEDALNDILTAVQALNRGPAQIDRLEMAPTDSPSPSLEHHFALTLRQATQVIHGVMATDALGLMLLAGLVAQLPTIGNALDDDALPILLRAEIGRSVLTTEELARLAIHDVIRIEHAWVSQGGELWLGQDSFGVRARWDDTQLTITQALGATGLKMPTPETPESADNAPIAIDRIPVQLTFDLGERSLPLAELKALQPGQALDLGRPLTSPVNIRANGALIGLGTLIEIDGNLGVTITALAEKTP
jgi:type III secretion protein Q